MAHDNISIADNTTVVGGPFSTVNRKDLMRDRIDEFQDSSSAYPKKGANLHEFSRNTDYSLEERPFFVPIGTKGGVIAALEKVDAQLRSVSTATYPSCSFQCSTFPVRAKWSLVSQGEPLAFRSA